MEEVDLVMKAVRKLLYAAMAIALAVGIYILVQQGIIVLDEDVPPPSGKALTAPHNRIRKLFLPKGGPSWHNTAHPAILRKSFCRTGCPGMAG